MNAIHVSLPTHHREPDDPAASAQEQLARFSAAVARTDALIERGHAPAGKSPVEIRARAELRLARLRRFLDTLGNPQDTFPIVHVGGTSGKGSTSTAIAAILIAAGYRTGLHTSPYLQVASEKLQLDGRLIAPDAFAGLADDVLAAHGAWLRMGEASLTYGEVWVAMLATYFARERVDVAVIEVGAGGRFDLTNVVRPQVSVITSVGLDHTVTLGKTIPEIAWHKAGIIKPGAMAVTAVADPAALAPIVAEAEATGAPLTRVLPGETYEVVATGPDGTVWRDLTAGGRTWRHPLPGRFQAANAATALAAVRALASRGFAVSNGAVAAGFAAARIPGRCETVQLGPRVILDGAHNPQKIGALVADLPALVGRAVGNRLIVVLGVLEAKDASEIARLLAPYAAELILTVPEVLAKPGTPVAALAETVQAAGFAGRLAVEPDPHAAVDLALARAAGDPDAAVLVTGSLYLVGNVRDRWYPDDAVILQRTAWPTR